MMPSEPSALTPTSSCLHRLFKVMGARYMPSGGALSNPKDKEAVLALEDQMIEAYGKTIAVSKCKAGGEVDLSNKMMRAVHMDALGEALAKFLVVSLELRNNQLGPTGGATLADAIKGNTTLKSLKCAAALRLPFLVFRAAEKKYGHERPTPAIVSTAIASIAIDRQRVK